MDSSNIVHYVIRVQKRDSAFLYFQLEANEGLCFYYTCKSPAKGPYRDMELKGHISLKKQIDQVLDHVGKEINIQLLSKKVCSIP